MTPLIVTRIPSAMGHVMCSSKMTTPTKAVKSGAVEVTGLALATPSSLRLVMLQNRPKGKLTAPAAAIHK